MFFSIARIFLITVGENDFGNKIPIILHSIASKSLDISSYIFVPFSEHVNFSISKVVSDFFFLDIRYDI